MWRGAFFRACSYVLAVRFPLTRNAGRQAGPAGNMQVLDPAVSGDTLPLVGSSGGHALCTGSTKIPRSCNLMACSAISMCAPFSWSRKKHFAWWILPRKERGKERER